MATLTCTDWLDVWERSLDVPPLLRPCALLAPLLEEGQGAAEQLPIGQRDAWLLDLHQALFGPEVQALACCPQCAEQLEVALDLAALRVPAPGVPPGELEMRAPGCLLRIRLPHTRDLAALAGCADAASARRHLLERCVRALADDGAWLDPAGLAPALVERAAQALAEADPQAITELRLNCPACGHGWSELFDIGRFLLHALDHWAERLLDTVHVLACAYGWSEREILVLSPARRARYLARVAA